MTDFINFEEDDVDDIDDDFIDECEPKTVSDDDFIDDDNVQNYYAFTNVCRSVEDTMQDSFLEFDSSESQPNEVSNYCNDNYNPSSKQISKFRDSAKQIEEYVYSFRSTQFGKSGFLLLCNSLCYSLSP